MLLLGTLTLVGLACGSYLVDNDTSDGRDGGTAGLDGMVPGDAATGQGDAGHQSKDTGFGSICGSEIRQLKLSPLDMMVVLDVSYSMDYDQKWSSVKAALKSFVNNPEFKGLGVGLQYFPLRLQCRLEAYQAPAMPIGVLGGSGTQPDVAPVVAVSLDQQEMAGGTPTVQVLEGTTAYVKAWLKSPDNADHKAVVVMATDGVPDDTCRVVQSGLPNSLANVLVVAQEAATTDPQVKTFVIGVGKDLNALDQIAAAGGTGQAILVDTSNNPEAAFLDALTQIRRSALGCEFEVPDKDTIKKDQAQVRFVPDDGTATQFFLNVADKKGCAKGQGWYFDDPGDPRLIILCDETCTTVTQGKTGQLYVEFACKPL
jgi:hypothetical protein